MDIFITICVLIDATTIIGIIAYTFINITRERKEYMEKYYHIRRFALDNLSIEKYNELDRKLRDIK